MTLPNFVIVGCPKCGTTSLADWLKAHPDCDSSSPKEPFYFMDVSYEGRDPGFNELGLEGYKEIFSNVSNSHIRFEATTHYYYQSVAPPSLKAVDPNMKILVVFRQPSDRLYSWYQFNLNHLASIDPALKFHELVDLLLSDNLDTKKYLFRDQETFDFFKDALVYGEYIRFYNVWRGVFGENFKVLLLDDIKGRKQKVVSDLCDWLGLDSSFYDGFDFESSNVAYNTKNKSFHRFATRIAKKVQFGGFFRRFIAQVYWRLQKSNKKNLIDNCDRDALILLDEYYKQSMEELAHALGRPELISLWGRERSGV